MALRSCFIVAAYCSARLEFIGAAHKKISGIPGMIEKEFAENSTPEYVAVMIVAAALVDEAARTRPTA